MKVILVDKHPVTRLGLRALLQDTKGVEVVGEAADIEEVRRLNARLRPDLMILDPNVVEEGADSARCEPFEYAPRVLIYTALNSRELLAAASLAGADAFVHKEVGAEGLLEAIERIRAGERVWMLGPAEAKSEVALRARIQAARLTPREKEILDLLLRRRSNPEIAAFLHVSINTVRTHVKHVMKELGMASRRELLEGQTAA